MIYKNAFVKAMTLGRAISDNNNKMIIPTDETFWEASCNNANHFKTYFKMSNNVLLKKKSSKVLDNFSFQRKS